MRHVLLSSRRSSSRIFQGALVVSMLAVPASGCSSSSEDSGSSGSGNGAGGSATSAGGTSGGGQAGTSGGGSTGGASLGGSGGASAAGNTAAGGNAGTGAGAAAGSTAQGGGGSGGESAGSGGQSSGGAAQGGSSASTMPTHLPTSTGTCPSMSKLSGGAATFAGQAATVWSGDPAKGPGPLLVYYYATGSSPLEPTATIGQAQIAAITAMGGAVVAQDKTTAQGSTTGNNIWYTGDAAIADEIVACALSTQNIDPRRIYVAGYSAGALQTTYMWFARSGYVAGVISYSGGEDTIDMAPMQDPAHPPAAVVAHGAKGLDTYGGVIDFFDSSTAWETDLMKAGAFTVDCNDGGVHGDYMLRTKIAPEAIQLLLDHPYGVSPEPYTMLPSAWPSYCSIK